MTENNHSSSPPDRPSSLGPEGCYLIYESDSGGKLTLFYSKGEVPSKEAVGFWAAGESKLIQGFKFNRNCGRSELIKGIAGGDSNRRKFFVGWCQFIKLAKAMNGSIIKFPNSDQGVEVDIYGFRSLDNQPVYLDLDEGMVSVVEFDAVAVTPKHNDTFRGIKTLTMNNFLDRGNIVGASTMLT
mmetsp:Transcript_27998/g.41343  ORF Transcript_27998/g.41343 Transcript_27998/m.41343 type:complete len:184 (-) Transcript_27998:122-673(-)|eukprot:CAMPEP_0194231128 /NCGR_PEP_ID=MMETSP0156-20130528/44769_1 /TAXON_ID=33649 /ORGANISM="Thalassionema nitzschioides, Strain L26-B" /LENGTH=183 /DNA_ID=CAMNT_0038963743 /DNA_START=208 /DNA_END=759 /DNA_ORIENTATION=-